MTERKVTASVLVKFIDMGMDSTDAAREIINSVMQTHGEACQAEIKAALETAGARDVTIRVMTY